MSIKRGIFVKWFFLVLQMNPHRFALKNWEMMLSKFSYVEKHETLVSVPCRGSKSLQIYP